MTLTPPFSRDEAARRRAQRLLKKIATDAEGRSLKRRRRDGEKIGWRIKRRW